MENVSSLCLEAVGSRINTGRVHNYHSSTIHTSGTHSLSLSLLSERHAAKTPSISFSPAEQLFSAYSPAIIRVSNQCTILGLFFTRRHNGGRGMKRYIFTLFFKSQSIHRLIVLVEAGGAGVTCHHGDGSLYFMPEQFC